MSSEKINFDNMKKQNLLEQKINLLQLELTSKTEKNNDLKQHNLQLSSELENMKKTSSNNLIQAKNQNAEFKLNNINLKDQVEFYKSQNLEMKKMYEKILFNFSQNNRQQPNESPNKDLISINKTLSTTLSKAQNKIKFLEEQVLYYKPFKKIIKYSNSTQCRRCFKDMMPSVFIEHLSQCGLDTSQSTISRNSPMMMMKSN